jgi:glycosyltransferase involved in cell wall biosynthesis
MDLPPILCFSNMEWDAAIPTNRQQLMRRFAAQTRVIVVEAPLPVVGSVVGRSRGRVVRHGWRTDGDVTILQAWDWLPLPLRRASASISRPADAAFRAFLVRRYRALRLPPPILWLYPFDSGDLIGAFRERLVLYHCVDNNAALAQFTGYRRSFPYSEAKQEAYLVRHADVTVVTAPQLREQWRHESHHVYVLPNVADTALFQQALVPGPEHSMLHNMPHPRIAYVGALDRYKVDFALLAQIAHLRPDWHFICVGPVGVGDATRGAALPVAPNLHYHPLVPQHELPSVLRGCDQCIIPYVLNHYTAGVSPLKLYEYLAAGRPTVATPLPALLEQPARGLTIVPPEPQQFVDAIAAALPISDAERRHISHEAQSHSWDQRIIELTTLLRERLQAKDQLDGA